MDVVLANRIPRPQLIVQSFWPPNLSVARSRLPGVQTSFLTLASANSGGPAFATANAYNWVSPGWPIDAGYMAQARSTGRRVVPYTLDAAADIKAAAALRVDAVITNDPLMAQRALGLRRADLAPDRIRPRVRLVAPRASDTGRGRRFRIRWSGSDRGSGSPATASRRGATRTSPLAGSACAPARAAAPRPSAAGRASATSSASAHATASGT